MSTFINKFLALTGIFLSLTFSCYSFQSFSTADYRREEEEGPWFTGPLLTPSATAIPFGHFNFEPYLFFTQNKGVYDKNWRSHHVPTFTNVNLQLPLQLGIAPDWEFDFVPI